MDIWIHTLSPYIVGSLIGFITVSASVHVLLTKRDTRAAVGWIGVIWLAPILGGLLYLLLGINRIERRAKLLRAVDKGQSRIKVTYAPTSETLSKVLLSDRSSFGAFPRYVDQITHHALLDGNDITVLQDGDVAYASMLEAIDRAKFSVTLCSYIFENNRIGEQFIDALCRAESRQVEVRILVDHVGGTLYTWPPIFKTLKKRGLRYARFLPISSRGWVQYLNLRTHRKILVVDGRIGFTGGMNISAKYVRGSQHRHPGRDLHFRVQGPVVRHLQEVFAQDWAFSTNEPLQGKLWFPKIPRRGNIAARGVPDGPDEDSDKLYLTLLGAITCATRSIQIITPYFLPDTTLLTNLNVAAMRGVEVDIIIPEKNNILVVQWACLSQLQEMLEKDCRIWLAPPPFDHSKFVIVDGIWGFIGSSNLDPRSLRLNFEFNLEFYDHELSCCLDRIFKEKRQPARQVLIDDLQGQPLLIKLRNHTARLFSPYL